eukprot:TRINITY_DN28323_c0_g1_i2.p1 TRINITY_DN28323_c0_g1~~TRINITY_DN28323_c0_g1_i2.p1  ORF type:complete len:275 (+),score=47.37 TRINITY_DN28323_c0_g1_i2:324-1148(+)
MVQRMQQAEDQDPDDKLASNPAKGRDFAALGVGAIAGGVGGALGLGGGFLVVPFLTLGLKVEPRLATGTSAAVVLAVSLAACRTYLANGIASVRAAAAIAFGAVVTARFGAMMTSKVNPKVLKKLFGIWLLIVSFLIGAKAFGLLKAGSTIVGAGEQVALLPLVLLGSVTGFISGLLGVGGGTVLVPTLSLLFAFPQVEAQGCALLGMVPPSFISTYTHWRCNNIEKRIVWFAVAGALLGGSAGSSVASILPEKSLRIFFSAVLLCVGGKYLRS